MKTEKKQKRRKAFSLLLAIVLAATGIDLSLFTATVMADNTLSGPIGANVSWSYDEETNTLAISGVGAMSDYPSYSFSPFRDNGIVEKEGIRVTIDEGVTKIGAHVFEMLQMEEIQIPESVTEIGNYAFSTCRSLTQVKIPEKAKTIGENAFANCSALASVEFEGTQKSLGKNSFRDCSSLTSVDLTGVKNIGVYAFYGAHLSTVNLTGVEIIESGAFYGTHLSAVDLTGVKSLDNDVFSSCKSLTSVTLPDDLKRIPYAMFRYCEALKSVTIPDGVVTIEDDAFFGSGLTDVIIPDSVTSIGKTAFSSCTSLTSIKLPSALGEIPEKMFWHCSALTSVEIPKSVTEIGVSAFSNTGLTSVTIPENVAKIGAYAFLDTGLTSVEILGNVTEIGASAFSNTGLTSVTIPESVTGIGNYAFYGCEDLSEVVVEGGEPATIGLSVFDYCKFVEDDTEGITVPEAAVGAYLAKWKVWSAYIGNKKEAIKQVIETALGEYTATKDTTEEEIKNTVEQKLAEIGLSNATVVVEDFQKTDTKVSGTVNVTVGDGENAEKITVPLEKKVTVQVPMEGLGTEEDPYQVNNKEALEKLRDLVNGGADFTDIYFLITADIDLEGSGQNKWNPIGTAEHPFTGILDGDSHTISGLYINDETADNQGLFGVNAGTIQDVMVEGMVTGHDNAGGIAGINAATGLISGCVADVDVTGNDYVGGIAGKNEGMIENCTSYGTVTGNDYIGGIAGSNEETGTIKNGVNNGNVSVKGDGTGSHIGGITGENKNNTQDSVTGSYFQTDEDNKDITGIGGQNDADSKVTSGNKPFPEPGKEFAGQGTQKRPYQIYTEEELKKLQTAIETNPEEYKDAHFELMEDIALTQEEGWTPIGTEEKPFEGIFNGNDHTVSGLKIEANTADNQGIFGVNAGTIENLVVEGSVTGKDNVGGIAGTNKENGVIKDCTSNVTVTGENNVGGIAGKNDGTITGCTNNGTVTGNGTGTGGIVGNNNGLLKDDTNTAAVTGKDDVGGVAGTNGGNGTVEGCANSGNVTGKEGNTPGAVIGNNQNAQADAVKNDYYQKTDTVNQDLTGIGEGTGAGTDPVGITSGQTPTNPDKPFKGSGTAEDPYKITGKDDLEKLRDLVNGGKDFTDTHFEVTKDIDLEGGGENPWTPIGTVEKPFEGIFNGNDHTVSGLKIEDNTADNQGLFGVNAGTIENLVVEGSVTGKDNVGGIAGINTNTGTIKDCTSSVTVTGENNVGGIAGRNDGTITDCTNKGTVTGTGTGAGGIAGNNSGSLDNDTNTASVTGKDDVGGVTGSNGENGTVEGCTNSGNVTVSGDGDSTPGAVIGNNQNTNPDAVKDDYYQKTDTVNKDLTGIGEGTGAGRDPAGITSGQTPTRPEKPFDGSGTVQDPYKISSKEDLEKLRDLVNGGSDLSDVYFELTKDIDLGDGGGNLWTPIGTKENPFKGTLDGNRHTVSGLHINDETKDDQGLFGVNAGTIEDMTVEGNVTGKDNVGGIAGTNTETGVIKDCTSSVTVTGENNVGGVAGKNDGTIMDCTNNGTVTGTGNNAGGIAGNNTGTVIRDNNTGAVNGNDNVGGITRNNTGTVEDSTNRGSVTGKDDVGGIAGKNDGTIADCTNNGTVTGTGNNAGGITGSNTGTVNGSDNTGAVNGNDNVGGIAGTNNGSLKNDTNTAPVTGKDDVGGITGTNGENGTVGGCTNSGDVTVSGDGDSTPGAIIGNNQNTNPDAVKDDYYQKTDTVNKDLTGIGEGTGAGGDPAGITSGQTPTNPGENPAETDRAAAKAFEDEKIAAIERATPVGGAAWKQAVKDAVEAFGRLTAGQKELVSANAKKILSDAQAVLAAVEKIEAIGTVVNTAECGQKIKAARDAYNKLTSDQKAKIPESMKKILTDAERAYAALQNGSQNGGENLTQEEKKQIQEIAKELGVSEETAAKIQAVAKELGVSVDTILLNDDTILKQKSENDVKGSTFARLKAKASKVTKTSVKLTWKKVKGADGYLVYGTKCGIKNTYKLLKTVKKSSTAYTQKKLKKGGQYKYIVRAYKLVDGKKITIAASKTVHAHTAGGKYGNPKSVTVNKTRAYLVKGKSLKVKAAVAKTSKKLKRHRSVWVFFESSNTKVATVTKKGVIKAKAKGTCTIYVYAQNGVYKEIKVTVAGKAKKSTSIKLNKKKYSMKKGASYTLKPTVKPATSTDTVKWTSSNKKVAAVDAYGTVKAKKKGTATITAKTTSGKKATCKITVK